MPPLRLAIAVFLGAATAAAACAQDPPAREWFRGWEMEDRIAQAQLCLLARVSQVKDLTVVQGAKADSTIREYHFQPVRVLKGIFSRDELVMTGADLGLPVEPSVSVPALQQGELRLLLLTRTTGGFGCVSSPAGAQDPRAHVPLLASPEDPVAAMAETLVKVTESPSRRERAELCLRGLAAASGPAAVPLTLSLARRAMAAARLPETAAALRRGLADSSPAVRDAAIQTLEAMLARGRGGEVDAIRAETAEALRRILSSPGVETGARVAALNAAGRLGAHGKSLPWPEPVLSRQLAEGSTHAERTAAAAALAELGATGSAPKLVQTLAAMPFDEDPRRVQAVARAAARLDAAATGAALVRRIEAKVAAGRPVAPEAIEIARLRHRDAVPALIRAAAAEAVNHPAVEVHGSAPLRTGEPEESPAAWIAAGTASGERASLALAFQKLGDARALPILSSWLYLPDDWLRERAFAALDAIDSPAAVQAIRLRFRSEPQLALKLRMARCLGRHGIADGYALALEHLADPGMTGPAAAALAAIGDARAAAELWRILESSHDRAWNAAALLALAAVNDSRARGRIAAILVNPGDPLMAGAARAAAMLPALDAAALLHPLAASRHEEVVLAALDGIAAAAGAAAARDELRSSETAAVAGAAALGVLNDPHAGHDQRRAAMAALSSLGDSRLEAALQAVANEAALEGQPFLERVERELAARDE